MVVCARKAFNCILVALEEVFLLLFCYVRVKDDDCFYLRSGFSTVKSTCGVLSVIALNLESKDC